MKHVLLFPIIIFSFACDKPVSCGENTCSVTNPLEEMGWLQAEINDLSVPVNASLKPFFYVTMAKYNGNTVFMVKNCCPLCNTTPPIIKNCNGKVVGYLSEKEGSFNYFGVTIHSVNPNKLQCNQIIWKPDNFACQVSI